MPTASKPSSEVVEFEVRKPPPAATKPITAAPTPPKPQPRKVAMIKRPALLPPEAPRPNREQPKPSAEPPKPVFGITMESTVEGDSSVSVPVGNTTMIDPRKSAPHTSPPPPLQPAARRGETQPVSELYIKELPYIDNEKCQRSVPYPEEAFQLGIEGEVLLRVELDEKGQVRDIKVTKGVGHGLDQAAIHALKHKCKFTPAIATDGKPVPYVIPKYSFTFELAR